MKHSVTVFAKVVIEFPHFFIASLICISYFYNGLNELNIRYFNLICTKSYILCFPELSLFVVVLIKFSAEFLS